MLAGSILKLGRNLICQRCLGEVSLVRPVTARMSSQQHAPEPQSPQNEDIKVKKTFINRNPRNLERLSLAPMDRGWGNGVPYNSGSNFPCRAYYHRIYVDKTQKHVTVYLEHYYGRIVFAVSTKDWKIRRQLYKGNDVSACKNLGRLLAERCIRSGISCAQWSMPQQVYDESESIRAVYDAIAETGFALEEPDKIQLGHKLPHWVRKGPEPVPFEGIGVEKS